MNNHRSPTRLPALIFNKMESQDPEIHAQVENSEQVQLETHVTSPKAELQRMMPKSLFRAKSVSQTRGKAGNSIMGFFHTQKFAQKLRSIKLVQKNLCENHLKVINDASCDEYCYLLISEQLLKQKDGIMEKISLVRLTNFLFQNSVFEQIGFIHKLQTYFKTFKNYIFATLSRVPQIHPENPYKIRWDYWISILRFVLMILIPIEVFRCIFKIAYEPHILFEDLFAFTIFLIINLITDLILRFDTIYYLKGQAVNDRFEISKRTAKNALLQDSSIIVPLIYFSYNQSPPLYAYYVLLTVFLQAKYIQQVIKKGEQSSYFSKTQKGIFNLVKLVATLIFILHMFSCIWIEIAKLSPEGWLTTKCLLNASWTVVYLEAFYFGIVTMLTIGYGDNVPISPPEKITIIIFILGACLWFSYIINTIGNIINEISQNKVERNRKLRIINRYMDKRKIPYSLQYKYKNSLLRIREYVNFKWKQEEDINLDMEHELLSELSDELKQDLNQEQHNLFIKNCEYLKLYFSSEFLNSLCCTIERKIIQPQQIFTINTLSDDSEFHLCYIEQGQIQYQYNDKQKNSSNFYLENKFVEIEDFILEDPKTQRYKAIGYVSLLLIKKSVFVKMLHQFPNDYQIYQESIEKYLHRGMRLKVGNGQFCPACCVITHNLNKCPQLTLKLDRELIIKRHQFPLEQERATFDRPIRLSRQSIKAVKDQDLVEQFAFFFQNTNRELIDKQLMISYIPDQDQMAQNVITQQRGSNKSKDLLIRKSIRDTTIQLRHSRQSEQINQKAFQVLPSKFSLDSRHMLNSVKEYGPTLFEEFEDSDDDDNKDPLRSQNHIQFSSIEFNKIIQGEISQLYFKVKNLINEQKYDHDDVFDSIEMLYLQTQDNERFDEQVFQLDSVKIFENYWIDHNVDFVLSQLNTYGIILYSYSLKLTKYLNFPYDYINLYQKIKQKQQRFDKMDKQKTKKKQKGAFGLGLGLKKIVELKNKFINRRNHVPTPSITKVSPLNQ